MVVKFMPFGKYCRIRPLFNQEPVGNGAAPVMLSVTLPALLLTTQVFPQRTARTLVGIEPLVHGFDTDGGMVADLIWTPAFTQPVLGEPPSIPPTQPALLKIALHP